MRDTVVLRKALVLTVLVALAASGVDAQDRSYRGPPDSRGSSSDESSQRRVQFAIGFMQRMDRNGNGHLDRDEISDRARPYIERYARLARLDMSRPLPIKSLEGAVRQYYSSQGAQPSRGPDPGPQPIPDTDTTVPGFGQVENLPPIPGFGTDPEPSLKIERADLASAAERLRQYDVNRDGFLDREEIRRGRWSDDPFQYDKNRDNRLSQQELGERYARRRISEANREDRSSSSPSRPQSDQRPQGPSDEDERRRREEEERRRRQSGENRETWYLTGSLMRRYDLNQNGVLDGPEWRNMGIKAAAADTDGDGRINPRELSQWLQTRAANPSQLLPRGLPSWFAVCDANGDGQVVMAEFTDDWTEDKAAEFTKYDLDQDGIVTPQECLKAASLPGGTHSNHQLQIIPARGTVYSEIVVRDDATISNLDVQISITHTYDEHLDAFLIGPDGERVELFTAVGGSDDHFENTILDDEATRPITQGRPPFTGRYQPEAVAKRQPSLRHFYDKKIAGTWTLMINAQRSERPGALHGWSLINAPAEAAEPPGESDSRPPGPDYRPDESESRPRGPDYRPGEAESRPRGPDDRSRESEFRRPPWGGRPGRR